MKIDSPPQMRQRSLSIEDKEYYPDLTGLEVPLTLPLKRNVFEDGQKCQDRTPMMPLRHASGVPSQHIKIHSDHITTADDEESIADHLSVFSDLTEDPSTTFTFLDEIFTADFENSWRKNSFDASVRVEALGPLHEDIDDGDSSTSSHSNKPFAAVRRDSAFFEQATTKDMPPRTVVRQDSSRSKWTMLDDSEPMDCSFEDISTPGQDNKSITTITKKKACYPQQPLKQRPPYLQKLTAAFMMPDSAIYTTAFGMNQQTFSLKSSF
ncbi:unnamed protein product [Cylindrotheca closterium]|uniref:Uncharacterized protein n=1 Tax=Cylindrotheca closterium TaxID=2856 RepID=A0AAD2JL77_9STRA|nr:unnamed protein product [Cylindrotheca closterium]